MEQADADLASLIQGKTRWNIEQLRIQIAIDIASAMMYLYSRKPLIYHRDLKAGNVLVIQYLKCLSNNSLSSQLVEERSSVCAKIGPLHHQLLKQTSGGRFWIGRIG